jgi:hypothetical protein
MAITLSNNQKNEQAKAIISLRLLFLYRQAALLSSLYRGPIPPKMGGVYEFCAAFSLCPSQNGICLYFSSESSSR